MTSGKKLLLAGAVVAGLNLALFVLPLEQMARWLIRWARHAGTTGMALFMAAYLASVLLMAPGSLLTMAAGFAYGPLTGAAVVLPPSILGALIAFVLSRSLARPWVERRLARHPKFAALDDAVAENGFSFLLLVRLSPIMPFNLLNYALSLTKVPFWQYLVTSCLGMIPGTIMFTYLGSALTNLAQLRGSARLEGSAGTTFYWAGLGATLLSGVLGARMAQSALRRMKARATGQQQGREDAAAP